MICVKKSKRSLSTREKYEKNWEVWENVDVWDNERSLRYMWLKWEKCQKSEICEKKRLMREKVSKVWKCERSVKKARHVRKRYLWEKEWAKCENVSEVQK